MIYYVGGICAAIIFFISICYWSVNFFIKQVTERTYEQFRERLAKEAELALKLFREGLCEQIVLQEDKSDSLAKLYGTLIDLMQVGKEFTACLGRGDVPQAEKWLISVRDTCALLADRYQKQKLHFPDEYCALVDGFLGEQRFFVEAMEAGWKSRKDAKESSGAESALKQSWLHFEDRITQLMDSTRSEFRMRRPAPGNIMMKWLNEASAKGAAAPKAKPGPVAQAKPAA